MAHRINFKDYLYLQGHNVHITGKQGLRMPSGSTLDRPDIMKGVVRYNNELDQYELGTRDDILILNNRNENTPFYSKKGGILEGPLVTKNHKILNNSGTANEPSYSFFDNEHTGFYNPQDNNLSFIINSDINTTPIMELVRNGPGDLEQTVTIHGNLVIEGQETIINTERLEVEDNRIVLNKGGNSNGISGIDIEGSNDIQASFLYDFSNDKWSLENSTITDVKDPVDNKDVTNKQYVDSNIGNSQQELTDHKNATDPHTQYLRKDNSLQGLSDIAASRTTLDVYSTTEIDTLETNLQNDIDSKIPLSQKAQANGVATLDSNTKIPSSQLPAIAITETFTVADITARDQLVTNNEVQEGDVAIVQDDGNGETRTYIYDGSAWHELNSPGEVFSVNTQTGHVTLDYSDVNADQSGTAQSIMDTHEASNDPHTQYLRKDNSLQGLTDVPASRTTLDIYSTTEVDNNLNNIQQELDNTQTGAGLGTDGSYTADTSTRYINGATYLKNADKLLDQSLSNLSDSHDDTQQELTDHKNANDPHTQYLRKDNSLQGLTNISASRNALDIYSTTEVDNNISNATSKANQFTDTVTLSSGNTYTISSTSLPVTISDLRSVTVDLKVLDNTTGPTQGMWVDGLAVLQYGIDTTNDQIIVVNQFNNTLSVFIRIIM